MSRSVRRAGHCFEGGIARSGSCAGMFLSRCRLLRVRRAGCGTRLLLHFAGGGLAIRRSTRGSGGFVSLCRSSVNKRTMCVRSAHAYRAFALSSLLSSSRTGLPDLCEYGICHRDMLLRRTRPLLRRLLHSCQHGNVALDPLIAYL